MKNTALIVAGGTGKRMNTDIPKQFLLLKEVPILMHTIKRFAHFEKIILVLPSTQFSYWNELCNTYNFIQKYILVAGGKTRFHSVKNGLKKVNNNSVVAIHDGVRPLVSKNLIDSLISQTKSGVGVIPVIPVKDSIRKIEGENSVHTDRNNVYKVQTPQCFFSDDIKDAYTQKFSEHFTDDASVFEHNKGKINTTIGEEKNLKITTEEDLKVAEILL